MLLRHIAAWMPMVFVAIFNAGIRELTYGRILPAPRANQISVFTGIILFSLYAWFVGTRWPLSSSRQALIVGAVWFVLTVAFEFLFGHYAAHRSWASLLHEYDLAAGRLWSFIPLALFFLPLLIFKARD